MRRQARITTGGALVGRSASALQVWLWLLIFVFQNEFRTTKAIQPGYLDFDNLPETNFTCAGKVIGGYYADLETSCQMFHVCTVGTENETMDIKFLCLNGTVFDQETRVCERVDEVDCTKSEKFYSLNLELYGSLAPPIIQPEQVRPHTTSTTERPHTTLKPHVEEETDPLLDESPTTSHEKSQLHSIESADSTEDPIQDKKEEIESTHNIYSHHISDHTGNDEIIDNENIEYEDDYTHSSTTTKTQTPPSTTTIRTTTSTRKPTTTTTSTTTTTTTQKPTNIPHHIISSSPYAISSTSSPAPSTIISPETSSALPTLDPSILSPEEFTYQHRRPGSDAISFQRQSSRPADGIYITHAPPYQYDHFQYESSRTAPRPSASRPGGFVPRTQPSPFRTTTVDTREQLPRPSSTSQPIDRYNRHSAAHSEQHVPYDPFYYEHGKRSDESGLDTVIENESFLTARSVAPPTIIERRPFRPKSPPRVIVTASASVSDSNGRRLNYTVGNVVSAVKPIAQVNYDDYKESDFDPFFLDVPKLSKRRKSRSNKNNKLITVPATATVILGVHSERTTILSPVTSRATTTDRTSTSTTPTTTTTAAWNPNDYVDDNYEPHAYKPVHPFAILMLQETNNHSQDRHSNMISDNNDQRGQGSSIGQEQPSGPTMSVAQTTSSQSADSEAATSAAEVDDASPLQSPHDAKLRRRRATLTVEHNNKR